MRFRGGLVTALLALTLSAFGQERVADQIYMKQNGCAFTLDVFKPAKPSGAAVIWMVSGGWYSSHNDINLGVAQAFNARGITLVQVVHGAQPRFKIPEIIGQVQRAVRFVHAHAAEYGIDPNRIGVAGGSAGGHLSLMIGGKGDAGNPTATDPVEKAASTVNAVGVFFPPTDFSNYGKVGVMPYKDPQMIVFLPAFGVTAATPVEELTSLSKTLSPITYVTPKFPPTLLIHGDKDTLVPIQQSQVFEAALEKVGVEHHLITIEGGGHSADTALKGLPALIDWFAKKLGVSQ